jgi:TrmH family RNA methyltransferase
MARSLLSRAGRTKSGLFLLEGPKVITEALEKGAFIEDVLVSESFFESGHLRNLVPTLYEEGRPNDGQTKDRIIVVPDIIFESLTGTETPAGLIALARQNEHNIEKIFAADKPLVVICDAIQDPGNLGTMMRTAQAFGASGMIITRGTVDPYNPKVVRSASGALLSLPLFMNLTVDEAITECTSRELVVVGLSTSGDKPVRAMDFNRPCAVILGNEGQGLEEAAREMAADLVSIPIEPDCESLNVAAALAVVLYEAYSQRRRT